MSVASPAPEAGRQRALPSAWGFNLRQEGIALGAAALALVGANALSVQLLHSHYLQLQQADANRVQRHLQVHLNQARHQLDRLVALPAERWERDADQLLWAFSDLYELGDQLQVRRVLKAEGSSRVFPGFSFSGSVISASLRGRSAATSPISRGLEDEMASIYVLRQAQGRRLLGRIRLGYIKAFLKDYSAFSGTPLLLVSRDGFVMLSGSEQLRIASIDLNLAAARGGRLEPLQLPERTWIPVVSDDSGLGARIVTLLPSDNLQLLRTVLLGSTGGVLALFALIFTWKNLHLRRRLFGPVTRFAGQIKEQELRLRQGIPTLPQPQGGGRVRVRFRELAAIQSRFQQLLDTIAERDRALLEARQQQQRSEEEQRRQLQVKLHTSLVAAGIAHEINLPLSTIQLLCEQARTQLDQQDQPLDVKALVQTLSDQTLQVATVIETMRMLLRNVQTEAHPTDLVAVLQSAALRVKPLLHQHQVQLDCGGLASRAACMVQGDPVQLQVAVTNLLRNGIEAVAQRPEGRRRVRLGLLSTAGEQVVDVADSGDGFAAPPGEDTVLETTKPGGTGLGLFIVRTTAANHGGRLRFGRDEVLGGARVWLHLPAIRSTREVG